MMMQYSVDTAIRESVVCTSNAVQQLNAILAVMNELTFGFRKASRIVGGSSRLNQLIDDGKIRFTKDYEIQNSKYYLNASDVLRYAKEGYHTRRRT